MSDLSEFLLARAPRTRYNRVMVQRIAPECGCVTPGKIVRGMCFTHYDRWVHKTPKDQRPPAPRTIRLFWDRVDKGDGCWEWTGPTNAKGYGVWSQPGFKGLAHRYSLTQVTPPPDGAFACHHCDNPSCVNPGHLYWGTAADNAGDVMARAGVHNKGVYSTACPWGHEMSGENLRIYGGKRFCRTCGNARSRDRQRARRAAARGSI